METQDKLKVLTKIAKELNKQQIIWAVGASLLLFFKGITNTFNDIDIMVTENDIEKVKKILSSFGTYSKPVPNKQYKTKYFLEYQIENVEFDIMAGFTIINNGIEYYFPLNKSEVCDFIIINETKIPLQSLNQWKEFYSLMGRDEKVQMIENRLK